MSRAKWTIVGTYVAIPIICFPLYVTYAIVTRKDPETGTFEYVVNFSKLANMNGGLLKTINFWVFAVALKLIPCLLLTVLILLLVQAMYRADERRIRLKSNGANLMMNRPKPSSSTGTHTGNTIAMCEGNNNNNNTTNLRVNGAITHSVSASPVIDATPTSSGGLRRASNQSLTTPKVSKLHFLTKVLQYEVLF